MSARVHARNRALPALLLGLAVGAAGPLTAQQVTARVGGELTGSQYETVSIPVTVDMSASGGQLLGSYTARLTWNPSLLYYNGSSQADSSAQGNFAVPYINTDSAYSYGILKFTAVSPNGAGGLVTVANLRFYSSPDTVGSAIGLSFSEMSAAGTFASLLPILTTQGGTFCTARGRWGDLDRDGQSNSRDALFVLSKVVGLPVNPLIADTALADVDADGRATSRDALVILSYAVGIQVPGQRVLLYAPSSCGTGSATQVAVMPAAIDLVPNQQFRFALQSTDSAGRTVGRTASSWRSSDLTVAGVDVGGVVTPRAPGTATITAELGPGVRATATVTVIPRRPNWYVDIAATGLPVQNGSAAHPYEHPLGAYPWVGEGDTVRVTRGTYYFDNDGEVKSGIVLQGGTPGDTTTRPLFVDNQGYYSGLWLRGGQRTEVRNIAFRDFGEGIDLDGVRNLVIEDTRFEWGPGNYGDGIYHCGTVMDTVRIERATFQGDPQFPYGTSVYYSGCPSPYSAAVTIFRDSRVRYMDGIDVYGADSLAVIRSEFRDINGSAISSRQENSETPALYVAHSRFERSQGPTISARDQRRIVIDTSVFVSDSSSVLDLQGDYYSRQAKIYLHGDSIYQESPYYYDSWLQTYDTDSLVIEDVVVRAPDDTSTNVSSYINADVAIIRRSRFLNLGGSYTAFDFNGRRLLADSVTMTGCAVASCDAAHGFAIQANAANASTAVLRSSFTRIGQPIYFYGYGYGSVGEVRNVTIDSASYGITADYMDSVAVTDNVMTRVSDRGVDIYGHSGSRGPSLVARNAITCTTGGSFYQTGIDVSLFGAVVDQDTVTGCSKGVYLTSVSPGTRVRRSTLRNNSYGVEPYQVDSLLIPIDSNGISGSSIMAVGGTGRMSLFHNRIEDNPGDGFYVQLSGYVQQVHDNAFVNNTGWSINSPSDSVDASANYWGPSGGPPPLTQPNGVSGRINTSGELGTPPANLPGLAPPVFRPAPRFAAVAAATTPRPATLPKREPRPRPQPVYARADAPGRSPERVAQIERNRERRAAQQAAAAEREARRMAEQRARLAERAQREQAPTPQR